MNNLNLTGRLARDPEMKYVGDDDTPLATFTVAENHGFGANYFDVEAWGPKAENINEHFSEGDGIEVSGPIEDDEWEDDDGNTRRSKSLNLMTWSFPKGSPPDEEVIKKDQDDEDFEPDDELPF